MPVSNIPPMPSKKFFENATLIAEAAACSSNGQFEAAGILFDFKIVGWFDVREDLDKQLAAGRVGGPHEAALQDGYPYCYRLVAVDQDGNVYAVWEVYSKALGTLADSKSRTIEVDSDWTGRGIGTAFVKAVRRNHPVQWSGLFTPAGAKLKDRVES